MELGTKEIRPSQVETNHQVCLSQSHKWTFFNFCGCPLYCFIVYRNEDLCFLRGGEWALAVTAAVSSGSWEEEGHLLLLDEFQHLLWGLGLDGLPPQGDFTSKSCQQVYSFNICIVLCIYTLNINFMAWLVRF